MKALRILIICIMAILSLVAIYSIKDIVISVYYVVTYESFTPYSSGVIAGKALFLIVTIFLISFLNRKRKRLVS